MFQTEIRFLFLLAGLCLFQPATAQHLSIDVTVSNVKQKQGKMMIAVFDTPAYFLSDKAVQTAIIPVTEIGTLRTTLADLKAGEYAISIFHDLNDNGELDKNFMGIPTEPYGFSNNARGSFGPPKFVDAKFSLTAQHQSIDITLY